MKIRNRLMDGSSDGGPGGASQVWNPTGVSAYMDEVMMKINSCKKSLEALTSELSARITNKNLSADYGGDIASFWEVWNGLTAFFDDLYGYVKNVDDRVTETATLYANAQQNQSSIAGS